MKKIKNYFLKNSIDKIIFICSILFLIVVIVPLLVIAQYNVPAVDDYSYSMLTYKTYEETKSVVQTFGTAMEQVQTTYQNWQGSFSAVFLMALQPGIWGIGMYGITTFLVLGTFLFGNLVFFYVIFSRVCKASFIQYMPIFAIVTGLSILWCPNPVESFYWYNGSIYYTFYYGVMLFVLAILVNTFFVDKKSRWFSTIFTIFLVVFLGGGNYVTGLIFAELMVLLVFYTYVKKTKNRLCLTVVFIGFLISFIINMSAPGNAVRATSCESMSAIDSIFSALNAGREYLIKPNNIMIFLGLLLIVPLLWKITESMNYSFKSPLLVTMLSFGLFSSQFVPTLYAQSFIGPFRLQNIIWYSVWIFALFNILYWLGWVKNTINKSIGNNSIHKIIDDALGKKVIGYYLIIGIIYIVFMFDYGFMGTTSISAVKSLRNGEAKIYYDEYVERQEIISASNTKDVVVPPYSVKPNLLFFDDIYSDSKDWRNIDTARFYQLNSIRLTSEEENY